MIKDYANIIAAVILGGSIVFSAWMISKELNLYGGIDVFLYNMD